MQLTGRSSTRSGVVLGMMGLILLSGCVDLQEFNPFKGKAEGAEEPVIQQAASGEVIERDVERPDVFKQVDRGLWDGRPSLGGVWVAHPSVKEPERVVIRNTDNSKFVIGALFRRERNNPGPIFQVSSDAADALGMLAGAPVRISVIALRREEVKPEPVPEVVPEPEPVAVATVEEPVTAPDAATAEVEAMPLDAIAGAAAALDSVETAKAAPAAAATPKTSKLTKPYLQIGIFSVEQNAQNTAIAIRQSGMKPVVKEQSSQGKAFWRVLVGPAQTTAERASLLKKIKSIGFDDAYAVTN